MWERCDADGEDCEDITGATGTTYVVDAADACGTLQVAETMTNAAGAGTAVSGSTSKVPGECDPGTGTGGGGTGGMAARVGPAGPAERRWHRDGHGHRDGHRRPRTGTKTATEPAPTPVAQAAAPSCLRVASFRSRTRIRRVGVVRVARPAAGCLTTPLRASVRARKGVKLRSVRFRLDGKRLARAKKPRFRVRLAPAALGAGTHKLVVKVRPRGGKPRRAVIRLRVAAG